MLSAIARHRGSSGSLLISPSKLKPSRKLLQTDCRARSPVAGAVAPCASRVRKPTESWYRVRVHCAVECSAAAVWLLGIICPPPRRARPCRILCARPSRTRCPTGLRRPRRKCIAPGPTSIASLPILGQRRGPRRTRETRRPGATRKPPQLCASQSRRLCGLPRRKCRARRLTSPLLRRQRHNI